jgi:aminoglycoside N3'-acetyltransferase
VNQSTDESASRIHQAETQEHVAINVGAQSPKPQDCSDYVRNCNGADRCFHAVLNSYEGRKKAANTEAGDGSNSSCDERNDCDRDIEERHTDSLKSHQSYAVHAFLTAGSQPWMPMTIRLAGFRF